MIKKILFLSIMIAGLRHSAYSQITSINNVHGDPLLEKEYVDIKGSPYLDDEWIDGTVKLQDGSEHTMPLKFDLVKNYPCFRGDNGETLKFLAKVTQFSISNNLFENGYPKIGNLNPNSYYQLLIDGKVQLLKYIGKEISIEKDYSSANSIKQFDEVIDYYLYKNDKMYDIRDRKSIISALGSTSAGVEKYINDNKLNLKKEKDLITLVNYYNKP